MGVHGALLCSEAVQGTPWLPAIRAVAGAGWRHARWRRGAARHRRTVFFAVHHLRVGGQMFREAVAVGHGLNLWVVRVKRQCPRRCSWAVGVLQVWQPAHGRRTRSFHGVGCAAAVNQGVRPDSVPQSQSTAPTPSSTATSTATQRHDGTMRSTSHGTQRNALGVGGESGGGWRSDARRRRPQRHAPRRRPTVVRPGCCVLLHVPDLPPRQPRRAVAVSGPRPAGGVPCNETHTHTHKE